jgi:hypothetical protein
MLAVDEKEFNQRLTEMMSMENEAMDDNEDRDAQLLAWDEFMLACSEDQIERATRVRFSRTEP